MGTDDDENELLNGEEEGLSEGHGHKRGFVGTVVYFVFYISIMWG